MKKTLRLGTRVSPLALAQARLVRAALLKNNPGLVDEVDIVTIRTSGDWSPANPDQALRDLGGNKGFFTKEIEEALLADTIDIAAHSMKDMATRIPDGLACVAVLERGDPRDAFLSPRAASLDLLPSGSRVGTASARRQAQILARRPDLRVTPLRGNVETRLQKLARGDVDATILALVGLQRLGREDAATSIMAIEYMLPAAAQGAIGIEIRAEDDVTRRFVEPLNHAPTMLCVTAERALMAVLDGSCRTPIGAYATLDLNGLLTLEGFVAQTDGSCAARGTWEGAASQARVIGESLGLDLKQKFLAGS